MAYDNDDLSNLSRLFDMAKIVYENKVSAEKQSQPVLDYTNGNWEKNDIPRTDPTSDILEKPNVEGLKALQKYLSQGVPSQKIRNKYVDALFDKSIDPEETRRDAKRTANIIAKHGWDPNIRDENGWSYNARDILSNYFGVPNWDRPALAKKISQQFTDGEDAN